MGVTGGCSPPSDQHQKPVTPGIGGDSIRVRLRSRATDRPVTESDWLSSNNQIRRFQRTSLVAIALQILLAVLTEHEWRRLRHSFNTSLICLKRGCTMFIGIPTVLLQHQLGRLKPSIWSARCSPRAKLQHQLGSSETPSDSRTTTLISVCFVEQSASTLSGRIV